MMQQDGWIFSACVFAYHLRYTVALRETDIRIIGVAYYPNLTAKRSCELCSLM